MTKGSIARRYAKALLSLAHDEGKVELLGDQLASLAKVLEGSQELFETLRNPAYPFEQRKTVVRQIIEQMKLETLVSNFVLLVLDRKRIGHLPDMAVAYRELADEMAQRVRAMVTTAAALSQSQEDSIRKALAGKMGKEVILSLEEDPDIIGGIIAQVGNLKLDYSIRSQLLQVRSELAK